MALTQKLLLRQSQALVMTPQLMQAIKLLQLSNLELTSYVEAELERNPLLERTDAEGGPLDGEVEPAAAVSEDSRAGDWLGEDLATSRTDLEEGLGTRLDNVFPDEGSAPAAAMTASTIWKPIFPPRPRLRITSPSSLSWRRSTRSSG
jgi:RNA polymerase sigma-54 factor